ncbi:conserved hypothetical protein [Histoplasma capsulatum G186AR]|uniref:Aminoglycoside phosphotransferase domain-containing protein n=2 Tax=Ajellomyces capsulatus TaxID=5037 RepID=C0NYJ1_AJECG|nr:uncharacterized protein HCBG_07673 [Histoplasma capsulatum G186AR]EEH03547.1 conserved hypothetical protein [Histoplasma capsulatum G186AR]KAG5293884.1 hypothetical protein I7I52_05352 [Histoplasma capsulatum]QSS75336.1 hypothetical protein I7I50_04444 [Histoplasma capsulatum G186AR]
MAITRRLLREEITYSTAKGREANILHQLGYHDKQTSFFNQLNNSRDWIKYVVAHHLGLGAGSVDLCRVAEVEDWFHGSFNICVPVTIEDETWKREKQGGWHVLLRLPLPYRIGEAFRSGNGDEKVRCEAGTYAWLQENCPEVPIPHMYGFAMSTGETFTRLEHLPFLSRCFQSIRRRLLSWFNLPVPSYYARHQGGVHNAIGAGYLVIEYIEETQGRMLSSSWFEKNQHDAKLRTNFFRDLARILLSISRIPLPQIGSFIIDDGGFLRLSNRPFSIEMAELENDEIPTHIPRDYTYSTTDSYVVDTLAFHDSRLQNQPNAVKSLGDTISQMAALTAMRATFPLFLRRDLRRGPFIFHLTDLHQSNILVDEHWHITCLIDLEWACSHPVEMVAPPYWLSGKRVDELDPENYDETRIEFMDILAAEETQMRDCVVDKNAMPRLSDVMNRSWNTGTFWYTLALSSPTGLHNFFYDRIKPTFFKHSVDDFISIMLFYWAKDGPLQAYRKVSDKENYDIQLQQAFEEP